MLTNARMLFVALLTIAATTSIAEINDPNKIISFYGTGADSCGALVLEFKENSPRDMLKYKGTTYSTKANVYAQWLSGYLSAYNLFVSKTGDVNSASHDIWGPLEWIHQYCKQNPTDTVIRATGSLILFLSQQQELQLPANNQ
ncbi:hypothetical protein ACH50O_11580 [Methylomonas sp. 2BW1-5-20]|uniref:hypothetical protein n=1 Tax=Methylomonas sp. 2BW1-5-20 TaxID=3376686 RepID=UPI00404CF49C